MNVLANALVQKINRLERELAHERGRADSAYKMWQELEQRYNRLKSGLSETQNKWQPIETSRYR